MAHGQSICPTLEREVACFPAQRPGTPPPSYQGDGMRGKLLITIAGTGYTELSAVGNVPPVNDTSSDTGAVGSSTASIRQRKIF